MKTEKYTVVNINGINYVPIYELKNSSLVDVEYDGEGHINIKVK